MAGSDLLPCSLSSRLSHPVALLRHGNVPSLLKIPRSSSGDNEQLFFPSQLLLYQRVAFPPLLQCFDDMLLLDEGGVNVALAKVWLGKNKAVERNRSLDALDDEFR